MPAHSCTCCDNIVNLLKLNPLTGSIIWKKHLTVPITGGDLAGVWQVEPLHGTNDILAATVKNTAQYVQRVSSTGAVVWKTAVPMLSQAQTNGRMIGSDSGGKILTTAYPLVSGQVRSIQGLDPSNGSNLWTQTYTGGENVYAIMTDSGGTVASVLGSATVARRKINTTTGATLWSSNNDTDGVATCLDSAGNILALSRNPIVTAAKKLDGTSGALLATASWKGLRGRFGYGGYSGVAFSTSPYAFATGGTGLSTSFALTTIAGASLSGKLNDTCSVNNGSGSPLYFFCGTQMTGTGGTVFSVFCVNGSGSFQWAGTWGLFSSTANAFSCCISDDGYLYVGGDSAVF